MNAIIYTRSATSEQLKGKSALEKQKELLTEYCSKNGIRIIKHFEEVASGLNTHRKEWLGLETFTTVNKVDRILVTSWDRIGRDFHAVNAIINKFSELNIEINTIQNSDFNFITFLTK